MLERELKLIKTKDKLDIALWKITSEQKDASKHIFLTHGTFSDKSVCLGIADYFAQRGYTCWIMEWRGHGKSAVPETKFNFETIAQYDIPAVFDYLFQTEKIKQLNAVTHSGGAIGLTMFLINHPTYISKMKSMVFFGGQAFGAAHNSANFFKIKIGKLLSALLGKIPAKMVGAKAHDESYYLMKQWFDWNLKKRFEGENGFDYQKEMPQIKRPILSICAKGDNFIAPKAGCEKFLNAFQNPRNQLLYVSKEDGYLEDYNHSRILHSRNAEKEIWPIAFDWIERMDDR